MFGLHQRPACGRDGPQAARGHARYHCVVVPVFRVSSPRGIAIRAYGSTLGAPSYCGACISAAVLLGMMVDPARRLGACSPCSSSAISATRASFPSPAPWSPGFCSQQSSYRTAIWQWTSKSALPARFRPQFARPPTCLPPGALPAPVTARARFPRGATASTSVRVSGVDDHPERPSMRGPTRPQRASSSPFSSSLFSARWPSSTTRATTQPQALQLE